MERKRKKKKKGWRGELFKEAPIQTEGGEKGIFKWKSPNDIKQ